MIVKSSASVRESCGPDRPALSAITCSTNRSSSTEFSCSTARSSSLEETWASTWIVGIFARPESQLAALATHLLFYQLGMYLVGTFAFQNLFAFWLSFRHSSDI